jgi:hypothetical protein
LDGGDAAGGWDENGRVRFGGMAWSAVVIRAVREKKERTRQSGLLSKYRRGGFS